MSALTVLAYDSSSSYGLGRVHAWLQAGGPAYSDAVLELYSDAYQSASAFKDARAKVVAITQDENGTLTLETDPVEYFSATVDAADPVQFLSMRLVISAPPTNPSGTTRALQFSWGYFAYAPDEFWAQSYKGGSYIPEEGRKMSFRIGLHEILTGWRDNIYPEVQGYHTCKYTDKVYSRALRQAALRGAAVVAPQYVGYRRDTSMFRDTWLDAASAVDAEAFYATAHSVATLAADGYTRTETWTSYGDNPVADAGGVANLLAACPAPASGETYYPLCTLFAGTINGGGSVPLSISQDAASATRTVDAVTVPDYTDKGFSVWRIGPSDAYGPYVDNVNMLYALELADYVAPDMVMSGGDASVALRAVVSAPSANMAMSADATLGIVRSIIAPAATLQMFGEPVVFTLRAVIAAPPAVMVFGGSADDAAAAFRLTLSAIADAAPAADNQLPVTDVVAAPDGTLFALTPIGVYALTGDVSGSLVFRVPTPDHGITGLAELRAAEHTGMTWVGATTGPADPVYRYAAQLLPGGGARAVTGRGIRGTDVLVQVVFTGDADAVVVEQLQQTRRH